MIFSLITPAVIGILAGMSGKALKIIINITHSMKMTPISEYMFMAPKIRV